MRWIAAVDEQVFAAAEADMSSVTETLYRAVAGDRGWDDLPQPVKDMLAANGPAIVADERNG
jgi:hypothetical protein